MTLATVAKSAMRGLEQKSPIILTGLGVAGVITTVILAVRVTPKAAQKLLDNRQTDDRGAYIKQTPLEKVKLVWPLYIPAALSCGVTIGAIIGAQGVNGRRQAALVGAFSLTETAFQEYKENVIEVLGANKEQKVRDTIVQNHVDKNPPPSSEILVIGSGNVLCLDTYTGRYFECTMEKIKSAQNEFNAMLINGEDRASLNEFYHLIDLPDTVVGEQVGFATENLLDINFSTAMTEDGRPCLAMSFRALPLQDYYTFR